MQSHARAEQVREGILCLQGEPVFKELLPAGASQTLKKADLQVSEAVSGIVSQLSVSCQSLEEML